MKKMLLISTISAALVACSTSEKQVEDAIKKNPDLVFNAIEQNPEKFIEVVNRAASKAQADVQKKRMAEMQRQQEEQIKNPLRPFLDEKRKMYGPKDAKVVIVEYADFQCPACARGHESLKSIQAKYKDKVQFYFKNMPLSFHPMALPAALYYEAIAKQDKEKSKRFYNTMFENQRQLKDEAFLKKTAQSLKVDMKKLEADMKSNEIKTLVEGDMKEFESFGFTGTPVVVINGVAYHGAQSVEALEEAIESRQ